MLEQPIPTLDEIDTLVHVATHAAISGGHRLVWLADLDAAIRRLDGVQDAGWDGLVQRARDAGAGLVLAVMLDRARRALGTPLPAGLLASLSSGGRLWLGLTGSFDSLRPVSRSYHRSFRGQLLVRATGPTTAVSLGVLRQLVATAVASRRGRSRRRGRGLDGDQLAQHRDDLLDGGVDHGHGPGTVLVAAVDRVGDVVVGGVGRRDRAAQRRRDAQQFPRGARVLGRRGGPPGELAQGKRPRTHRRVQPNERDPVRPGRGEHPVGRSSCASLTAPRMTWSQ